MILLAIKALLTVRLRIETVIRFHELRSKEMPDLQFGNLKMGLRWMMVAFQFVLKVQVAVVKL